MYPKFIITADGELRLGMVSLHKHLLERGETCLGGGYYEVDYERGMLKLWGESGDFGRPQWDHLETLRVPLPYRGLTPVYYPGSLDGYAVPLSDILTLEYD